MEPKQKARSLVILLLGILAFLPTLRLGFFWDDHEMIERNPLIRTISLENLRHAFSNDVFEGKGDAYFRPLQTIMNMIDYKIWGLHPFGYHLANLFFHVLAALLLFAILRLAFQNEGMAFIA